MTHAIVTGDAGRLPFPDKQFDMVFGSPPYGPQREYLEDGRDLGISRDIVAWVDWMIGVTDEAIRVTDGPVLWVAAGWTDARNYQPACEGLMWEWFKLGGSAYRPCYWKRDGIPGSGGDQHFRAQVEYVMCFKRPGPLPWSDNTACGHKPKYRGGGRATNRKKNGERIQAKKYANPEKANPGNFIDFTDENPLTHKSKVGGGLIGDRLAHQGVAPFPEDLAERFVLSFCPPGGRVLDPFGGTGTTACVAKRWHRSAVSLDLRPSQGRIARKRLAKVTPMAPALVFGPTEPAAADVQHSFLS